ncbi:head maturation protease, ClpP-related [uncultured Lactobacillus sp.]|uniref:head maturation protease, ClpP-related n=1 Tax=uncultured Lactobacillus sp. TaxID=153152 RepID=UPI002630937D|nr:head maturation protease, ClpP-related [uncultured Lactobacillus sp.]
MPSYLTIKQEAPTSKVANMYIDGEIVTDEFEDSDTSAAGFRDALKSLGDVKEINLHINSPGGSVFEGIAIYNMLKQNKAKVNIYIDALAASIASVIAMSGDAIFMPSNSMMMIHNPYTIAVGNANELRKAADDLDQITKASIASYLAKAGDKLDKDTLKELMDNETWLTADEAVSYGLADEVLEPNQAVASLDNPFAKKFKHLPKQLLDQKLPNSEEKTSSEKLKELEEIKKRALQSSSALFIELLNIKENF